MTTNAPQTSGQPFEHAPALRVYGDHAAVIARVLSMNPPLALRFLFAPRRAVHAIAAYLHLSNDEGEERTAKILNHHPRDLLRMVVPDAPATLYRALERAGDQAHDQSFYRRLATLCRASIAEPLLQHAHLDQHALQWAEQLLHGDSGLLECAKFLPYGIRYVWAFDAILKFICANGVVVDKKDLISAARDRSMQRFLQRYIDKIVAPDCGISLPAPFNVIRKIGDLRTWGKKFQNCVHELGTTYWIGLADGSVAYIACETPPMLISLRSVGAGVWKIEECLGPKNLDVGVIAREMAQNVLRQNGVQLVEYTVQQAFAVLDGRRPFWADLTDLEDHVEECMT